MDDFRGQLTLVIDGMIADGLEPVFLVAELDGIAVLKATKGPADVDAFRQSCVDAVVSAARGADAFTYGEDRIVAILGGFDRLKTFALIDRLRRALPLLGQSFDCVVSPTFDVIEYDAEQGVAGLINYLVTRPRPQDEVA